MKETCFEKTRSISAEKDNFLISISEYEYKFLRKAALKVKKNLKNSKITK